MENSTNSIDWSGARWLKATDTPVDNGFLSTIIDLDLTVMSGNPAVFFGWTADRAYFQWQIITDTPGAPVLRRCIRTYTDNPPYEDITLTGFSKQDIVNKQLHVRIEASGNKVTTFLRGVMVDTYKCNRTVPIGKAGIRVETSGEALFDNFVINVTHPNGKSRTVVDEDFSGSSSLYFPDGEITGGQCHVRATNAEYKLPTIDECYPTFYKFFEIKKPIVSAKLYASALGIYDIWINGKRVGVPNMDGTMTYDEMKPGWTDYNNRVTYAEYDVTSLCKNGENNVGAIVTPGWLGGRISRSLYKWPLSMAFIAKLEIKYSDGTSDVIVTDNKWVTEKYAPILMSDIYNGECFDGRRAFPWLDKYNAMPCKPESYDYPGKVEPQYGPPVRVMDQMILHPVKTVIYSEVNKTTDYGEIVEIYNTTSNNAFNLKPGETAILDFGQNCAGVPQITVNGNRGTHIHIRFGEMLNDTGELSHGNDGPAGSLYTANLRAAKAEIHYALRGGGFDESYSPTTTFFGYRYCQITADDDVTIKRVETHPWSSSYDLTGNVETDNEDVNRLFKNILWSQLSNFISVPMDCPQRDERLGWTADAQVFATTAMYNANVGDFYRKWLLDIRDSQREDGAYSDVSPLSLVNYGSAGWSDAGIVVPWQIYMMTGNKEAIIEHYDSMQKYMTWLSTIKENGLKYPGAYTTYGDLFAPHPADKRFVSQAYYYYDAVLMAKMSKVISKNSNDTFYKNALYYESLAEEIRHEIQSLHFDSEGLKYPTQGGCVIALWFDLYITEQQRLGLIDTLVKLIRNNGYRVDTGFLSTPCILQTLCDNGYEEEAYQLLTQHDYPSWMYMVDNGATTMWENWYCYRPETGFCDVQRNSFNHFGLGSFGSWMYSHMTGISPTEDAPGFEKVIFSPCIDLRDSCPSNRKINRAKATKITKDGMMCAEWALDEDGNLSYDVSIPQGIQGVVRLPVPSADAVIYESNQQIVSSSRIQVLGYADGRMTYAINGGNYHFRVLNYKGIELRPTAQNFKFWPNPARDDIYISCEDEIKEVCITTLSGKIAAKYSGNSKKIDVSSLSSGFYLATVYTINGHHIIKFIKI